MSKLITDYKSRPQQLNLAPRQVVSILAHRGTEVRVREGELWITQEGDGEDYVVAAGTRFCSGQDGRIVASALGRASRASVSWTDPGRMGAYSRSGVWLDYAQVEELQIAARRARAEELARLLRSGLALLARLWRRIARRRKPAGQLAIR